MNVVGLVGSLISQGVYSVATPFHPFGGAVDIIVVEQQDGTYRSTPWYVRFGKFQGVLKGAEKVVTIAVNGVEANFHMYLDNSGEAYFMREVTAESKDDESSDQVRDESSAHEANQGEEFCNNEDNHDNLYDKGSEETLNDEYGFQNEQSCKDNSDGSAEYNAYHYGSLEEVEAEPSENVDSEMVLVSVDGHVLTAPISSNEQGTDNVKLTTPQFHLGPGKSSGEDFCGGEGTWEFGDIHVSQSNDTKTSALQSDGSKDVGGVPMNDQESQNIECSNMGSSSDDIVAMMKSDDMFKSCLDLVSCNEEGDSQGEGSLSVQLEQSRGTSCVNDITLEGTTAQGSTNLTDIVPLPIEGSPCNGEMQSASIGIEVYETTVSVGFEQNANLFEGDVSSVKADQPCCEGPPATNIGTKASENKSSSIENINDIGSGDFPVCSVNEDLEKKDLEILDTLNECSETEISISEKALFGLGVDISLCGHLLCPGMGRDSAEEAFEAHCISEEEFKASGATIIRDARLIIRFKEKYFLWDKAAHIVLGMAVFGPKFPLDLKDAIPIEHTGLAKAREDAPGVSPTSSRRWRLWPIPFRRTRSLQHSNSSSSNEDLFVDTESVFQSPHAEQGLSNNNNQSPHKQFIRTKIPTNEQIASLDLKDGQNLITFSFSTRVLGRQQVDAHIYLWKWNARIVISDVDGTITKSDVLGQFMPLVGKDWTQSGVARLFSAIKENGYQLLFLSARAIVQAYLTRSFLLNLKQDGKALPNGPVVISPDGLFPSLYREVIRRAPHEFKIACLEDIRALFPSDYNPFYAGFGNRDTDELSYRKIGIPKGKIFIINPKGEVAINHCIDVKSYTSLHTLVNDMFPPTSLVEQEDYNTWNYWKVPLPNIDC